MSNTADEWDADYLALQKELGALDECIPEHVTLRQYRRWPDFAEMIEARGIRFRRADTFNKQGEKEGIVGQRIQQEFSAVSDQRMLRKLELAKFLYISCFTKNDDSSRLWCGFAPHEEDVCLVTTTGALQKTKPASVSIVQTEYGVDWDGPNPSDQIYQDRIDYEAICTIDGMGYEEYGDFSFARPLKYLLSRFKYQNEVRLVYSPVSMSLNGYSTWTSFSVADHGREVIFVPFPLCEVLSEVVVRIDAPGGHEDRARELLDSINCNAQVARSRLP